MKKNVLSLSIQAMLGGYWDEDTGLFQTPANTQQKLRVRARAVQTTQSDDILDFSVFLGPTKNGAPG